MFPKVQRGQGLLFVSHDSIVTLNSQLGMGRRVVKWRGKWMTRQKQTITGRSSVYMYSSRKSWRDSGSEHQIGTYLYRNKAGSLTGIVRGSGLRGQAGENRVSHLLLPMIHDISASSFFFFL